MCKRCEWEMIADIGDQLAGLGGEIAKSVRAQGHVTPRQRAVIEKFAMEQTTKGMNALDSSVQIEKPNWNDLPSRSKTTCEKILAERMPHHPRALLVMAKAELDELPYYTSVSAGLIPHTTNVLSADAEWWEALKVVSGSWPKAYVKASVLFDALIVVPTSEKNGLGRGQFDLCEHFLKQGKRVGAIIESETFNEQIESFDKLVKIERVIPTAVEGDEERDWKLNYGRLIFAA